MSKLPENPFWLFSLEIYARPDVPEACVVLQDRHGLDVNLLLFCCWAGLRGRTLERPEISRLIEAAEAWQEEVVVPLRRARRYLKSHAGGAAEPLRQEIKALELEAERLEQDRLFESCEVAAGEPDPAAAAHNLRTYLDSRGVRPGREDLAVLVSAGFGLARSAAERLLSED